MIITREGIYSYASFSKELILITTEVDLYLKDNLIYCSSMLNDGNIAIGTLKGGIVVIKPDGQLLKIVNNQNGLKTNGIYCLLSDKQGNLWAGTEKGISKIDITNPISLLSDEQGLEGNLLSCYKFGGRLYLGTFSGLYYLPEFRIENAGKGQTIKPIDRNLLFTMDFCSMEQGKGKENLLLSSSLNQVVEIKDTVVKQTVCNPYPAYQIKPSVRIPGRLFVGYIGLGVVDRLKEAGDKVIFDSIKNISQVNATVRSLETDKVGDIWLGTEAEGVVHIRFNENEDIDNYDIIRFDTLCGLPYMYGNRILKIRDQIFISTEKGIYNPQIKYNGNSYHTKVIKDSSLGFNYDNDSITILTVCPDKLGNYFAGTNKGVMYIQFGNNNEVTILKEQFRRIENQLIEYLYIEDSGNGWFCNQDALYHYDAEKKYLSACSFFTNIRKVTIGKDSLISFGHSSMKSVEERYEIDYLLNSIKFEFAAASFTDETSTLYSYYLEGYESEDAAWSSWSEKTEKEYTNLPENTYTFKIKARDINGIESELAEYSFTILAPWYRTYLAYTSYLVLFIIIFYSSLRLNSRRLKSANIQLEKIVDERTTEIRQQKQEIQSQADLLSITNKELEKLSIVASETDNAILIADAEGKIEWVNEAFTKIHGYSLEEFIHKKGDSLISGSDNPEINDLITQCIKSCSSIVYNTMNTTARGEKRWVQTTLTPILDGSGQLSKLVAIDSDISVIKLAEEEIRQQKEEILTQSELLSDTNFILESKNRLITDSIIYAKQIQSSILPSHQYMTSFLPEMFVLYKPKDIVSGDFYWFAEKNGLLFIAAVDCTGHGVPGAFMSMIGNTLLNQIVKEKQLTDPAKILDHLNKEVNNALQQSGSEGDIPDDGMDVSLCRINLESKEICLSLAGHIAIVVQNNVIETIRGNLFSIGGIFSQRTDVVYSNIYIKPENELIIYLFSDGYQDQFGEINNIKFGLTRLRELIQNIHDKPMAEQKNIFENEFEKWKGSSAQIDDILIMGIRI